MSGSLTCSLPSENAVETSTSSDTGKNHWTLFVLNISKENDSTSAVAYEAPRPPTIKCELRPAAPEGLAYDTACTYIPAFLFSTCTSGADRMSLKQPVLEMYDTHGSLVVMFHLIDVNIAGYAPIMDCYRLFVRGCLLGPLVKCKLLPVEAARFSEGACL